MAKRMCPSCGHEHKEDGSCSCGCTTIGANNCPSCGHEHDKGEVCECGCIE